ncbi:MAG: hypothetical protein FWE31_04790 [Firmicutes bacterium]|nr:hypothetical protein [Bacillota bacterium]
MEDSEKIIALASSISVIVAKDLDIHELTILTEFLGLLRHNLDVIRHRRNAKRPKNQIDNKVR